MLKTCMTEQVNVIELLKGSILEMHCIDSSINGRQTSANVYCVLLFTTYIPKRKEVDNSATEP